MMSTNVTLHALFGKIILQDLYVAAHYLGRGATWTMIMYSFIVSVVRPADSEVSFCAGSSVETPRQPVHR